MFKNNYQYQVNVINNVILSSISKGDFLKIKILNGKAKFFKPKGQKELFYYDLKDINSYLFDFVDVIDESLISYKVTENIRPKKPSNNIEDNNSYKEIVSKIDCITNEIIDFEITSNHKYAMELSIYFGKLKGFYGDVRPYNLES